MNSLYDLISPLARWIITRMSKRNLPQVDGKIKLTGLDQPVEIIRDSWGIPHIFANNPSDLFFAQGFVHAQDRLWQMELNRRTAQGKLSEIFGEIALDTDRTVRTFGFNRLAKSDWELFDDQTQEWMLAYSKGVNAYIDTNKKSLPVEFTLIQHKPDPWHPLDSIAFMRVMMWQLSHAWYGEIIRAQVIQATNPERAAELEIHYPGQNPTTLPDGIEFNLLDPEGQLAGATGPYLNRGIGSNSWAISGSKSITGKPYLCNDMHLQISLPSLWYHVHLIAEDYHVTGVSLPGIPSVLVGHNDRIAWGMTLAFTDCEDLFIERFNPDSSNQYLTEDGWLDSEIIIEKINIKGKNEPHNENVVITRHGPVISDVVGYSQERLAVNSMALRQSSAFKGWLGLNQASGWNDFVDAMNLIDAPQLGVTYADIEGNIGYWITGKVPIRGKGNGQVPVPGWTGEYEWVDVVPFDHMPHSFNPQSGYALNCNNCIIPNDYPYFLGNVWMNGYRAQRIAEVLDSKSKLSSEDFQKLQMDFTCLPGAEFISYFKDITSDDPQVQKALEILCNWDGNLNPESVGGTLYEVIRYSLVRNLLEPVLGEDLCNKVMGQGFHPLLLSSNEFYGHDTVTMLRLLSNPDSWWVQSAGGRKKLLVRSTKQALNWLNEELGADINNWQWGKIHRVIYSHALSLQKPLDKVFNRGPFPIGGDTDTICQTAMFPNDPYDNLAWAPSFRQIIDMSDLSRSVAVFSPGQSGQIGSLHYDDLIDRWLEGKYYPVLWTRDQIEKAAKARLILE
jgi:penicillin amidase